MTMTLLALAPDASTQVRQGAWTPVVESMDRGYSSISYWTYRDDGVEIGGGRISVEHGKPAWPAELEAGESFDAATVGKLWRLGNNKWTTLDTNLALRFGERRVEPGIYYLLVQRPVPSEWRLAFVTPSSVMPHLMDAWAAQARPQEVPVQFSVPLSDSPGAEEAELDITLALDPADPAKASLAIEWGPHRLESAFTIEMVSPTFYRESGRKK
jgi:hypothetical protein